MKLALVAFLIFLSACNTYIFDQPDDVKRIAVESIANELYGSPTDLVSVIRQTRVIESNEQYSIVKICDTNIECSCEDNYFLVNVSRESGISKTVENKQCIFG